MANNEIMTALSIIKADLIQKYGIKGLALFGSYADNSQNPDSDIDLLVFSDHKNYFKLIDMEHYISERLNKKVDLGFYDGMKTFIKKEIQEKLIYV